MTENLVIRPAAADDLPKLLDLSSLVGSGMTSMPTDEKSWSEKLTRSIADFNTQSPAKKGDIYFMVLEDLIAGELVGSGAIYVGIGLQQPFYSYKLSTITSTSEKLDLTMHTRVLNLVNDFSGTTEIGSLFLLPNYRRNGIGKFLSRSRFLLLADFPERFDETIFAEMRGWLDDKDQSPFWEALGKKFFGLSFQHADFISAVDGFQFISDLMPKFPVYLDLLPKLAQEVLGRPHDAAVGAYNILLKEGFRYQGYVDIFDAGPSIQAPLQQIKTVADSQIIKVDSVFGKESLLDADSYIISNGKLPNFRMTRAPATFTHDGQCVRISAKTAQALQVQAGEPIRVVKEHSS